MNKIVVDIKKSETVIPVNGTLNKLSTPIPESLLTSSRNQLNPTISISISINITKTGS